MKACVNKSNCIGCGMCVSICPQVFSMDEDGTAKAVEGIVEESLIEDTNEAASQCPVAAIELE